MSAKCTVHRQYKAIRRPTAECEQCRAAWTVEQRRAGFEEKVFAQRFLSSVRRVNDGQFGLQPVDCPTKAEFVAKDADGNYLEPSLNPAWWAWNAALDSVVIELPECCRPVGHDYVLSQYDASVAREEGYDSALDDCRAAIESAGLKVKP